MPQALALALFNLGAPLAVSNAVVGVGVGGWLVSTVGSLAISVGLSYLANILLRQSAAKPSDGAIEFQQPIPPRVSIYGRMIVSGPISLFDRSPESPRNLHRHILLCAREIDAYEKHFLDDQEVALDGDGIVQGGTFKDLAFLQPKLGTDDQVVDAITLGDFPDHWTVDHRLRGIAYVAAVYNSGDSPEEFQFAFSNGIPNYRGQIRGAKVYDPRLDDTVVTGSGPHRHDDKSTWEWSDNSALIVLDYLTHVDGYNRPIESIDIASFIIMAFICDEAVPLKAGGTEPRYRTAAAVSLAEPRKNVLARLLEACDATIQPTNDGKQKIVGGRWVEPEVVISADLGHIIEAEFSGGTSALDRYNELAIQYLSPIHRFVEVESEPWQDVANIAETGIIETRPLDLVQVPSLGQARRLAKIRIARDNPEWVCTIKTNFYGLDANGERCIRLIYPELNIDGPFWIETLEIQGDGTGAVIRARSANEASYDWDAATEESDPPPVPEIIEDPDGDNLSGS